MEPPQELVDALLSAVEYRELPSLRWGYVDGSLSEAEIDSLAKDVATAQECLADPVELSIQVAVCGRRQAANSPQATTPKSIVEIRA